jgi:glycosyltransferase involved in cell wall biosynthesis
MKIAIDCRMSGMSGIGVYLDNILTYLVQLENEDHYYLIGDPTILSPISNRKNCTIVPFNAPIFSLREMVCFPTKIINSCDVFYSPNYNIPFGIHIPIFSTIHDVVFLDVDNLVSTTGRFIRRLFLWRTAKISKKIFTVSNFSKSRIKHHFEKCNEIIVANSGINRELKAFIPNETKTYDSNYILFIGNIKKHKRLDVLLDAFEIAKKNGLDHKLVIIGDSSNFKSSDTSIMKRLSSLDNNIIFTGRIENDQLYCIISKATLLVQPSVYEGFGLPPMEAMYLGCDALISDIPVFKEIYGSLPVSFFKTDNVQDLAEKLLTSIRKKLVNSSTKNEIDSLYNLDRTAEMILNHLKNK